MIAQHSFCDEGIKTRLPAAVCGVGNQETEVRRQ